MSPYMAAFMIPLNITSCVAPCLDMPPHTWIWVGAYAYTLIFLASFSSENFFSDGTLTE